MKKNIYIGVAWPYVNGDLHLGHLSGYLLPADIFARYHRLKGNNVLMVSGSDCHGTPITVAADKEGIPPSQIVSNYHKKDIELFKTYSLSFNIYTKTTTANHKKIVQEIFLDLLKNGYIVKDTMQQYYSEDDNKFLPDRYVEGTCPHCNSKEQRSDQCESCGRWLKDGELIEPKSKLTGSKVSLKDTEHYFFDFPKLQKKLEEYVANHKNVWRNWVWQETNSWLIEGLQKRAITRDMDWAVDLPIEELKKLPNEMQLSDYTGKKIYVWFEAVIGYLSGSIEWSELSTNNEQLTEDIIYFKSPTEPSDWREWWQSENAEIYNFMGQDNLVFHTLMWPAMLLGLTEKYNIPHNVVVNKFMNYEGKKFSKSRNWTINSKVIAQKYGVDLVRYFTCANFPENKEASFTWEDFTISVNNELVANLGNLINRTLKFFESKFQGELKIDNFNIDNRVNEEINNAYLDISKRLEKCEFVLAIERLMQYTRFGNKYFDDKKIWEIIKSNNEEASIIMINELNIVFQLITLIEPFMPDSSIKLQGFFKQMKEGKWESMIYNEFKINNNIEVLFNKLDLETVIQQKDNE